MPFNLLGKILFPGRQRRERISKAKTVIGVVLTSHFIGGCLGVMLYLHNSHQK